MGGGGGGGRLEFVDHCVTNTIYDTHTHTHTHTHKHAHTHQTFTNAIETKGDENKLVFYHRVANTMFVDFKFVWKSSNAVDHLHLFASTGTAAFMGDNLDNVQGLYVCKNILHTKIFTYCRLHG